MNTVVNGVVVDIPEAGLRLGNYSHRCFILHDGEAVCDAVGRIRTWPLTEMAAASRAMLRFRDKMASPC